MSSRRILFNVNPKVSMPSRHHEGADFLPMYRGSINELYFVHRQTGLNTGNLIHWEAPARIFEYDRSQSQFSRLWTSIANAKDKESLRKYIRANFDTLVISEANFIQPSTNLGQIADFLEQLDGVDIFLFGAGLQNVIRADRSELSLGTSKFVDVIDRKACLFATRGAKTNDWLHGAGFQSSVSVGCPSLFAFPQAILGADYGSEITKVLTAGHLTKENASRMHHRYKAILELSDGLTADYVFQTEIFSFSEIAGLEDIFDSANSEFNSEEIGAYLDVISESRPSIEKYYYFSDADRWRSVAGTYDCYIGDRFHAGVAALQAGIPALFLVDDLRAAELSGFIGAPMAYVEELSDVNPKDLIADRFSEAKIKQFKEKYQSQLEQFVHITEEAGLTTTSEYSALKKKAHPRACRLSKAARSLVERSAKLKAKIAVDEIEHGNLSYGRNLFREALLQSDEDDVAYFSRVSVRLLSLGENDLAYMAAVRLVTLSPRDVEILHQMGTRCLERRMYAASLALFEMCCDLAPAEVRFRRSRVSALFHCGRVENAVNSAADNVRRFPEDRLCRHQLRTILPRAKGLDQATKQKFEELAEEPGLAPVVMAPAREQSNTVSQ